MVTIKNAKIFDGVQYVEADGIKSQNGKIIEFVRNAELSEEGNTIDAQGMLLIPGFIDLHMHGLEGADCMTEGGVATIAKALPKYGTTSFCPTSVSEVVAQTRAFLGCVQAGMAMEEGAQVLGAHLEGPFLTQEYRGVHRADALIDPTEQNYEEFTSGFGEIIRRITLAPEKKDALALIKKLSSQGIVVSLGHTAATEKDVYDAVDYGATTCTHMFNGMSPLNHRNPGAVGGILTDDRLWVEFIADMIHIVPVCIDIISRCKSYDKMIFCTDAMEATGMPDGEYMLGTSAVQVVDSIATINGKLAGSTLTMDRGLKNLVEIVNIPLEKAIAMGTSNVAKVMGIQENKGVLKQGADADFVLLSENLSVVKTFVRGKCEYSA